MNPHQAHLWINGQAKAASDGNSYSVKHPVTGQVVSLIPAANSDDIRQAINSSARAFAEWSELAPKDRRDLFITASDTLVQRQDDIKALMQSETGATDEWADFNLKLGAEMIREASTLPSQIKGEIIPVNKSGVFSMAIRQPLGVCLALPPWNAPIILSCRAISSALACGNTVLMKASELCPATHLFLGEIFHDSGFPPGVLNVISNRLEDTHDTLNLLISNPAIRHLNFTGSTRVGRILAERAARYLKPCLLELGGKAPALVMEDADLDAVTEAIVFGAFFNQGQICMSTERVIIIDSVADRLIEKLKTRITSESGKPCGNIISEQSLTHILKLISDAENKGAQILVDGRNGTLQMQPTLLDGVDSRMSLYSEESFGPLTCLIRVQDEEEAITIANDTSYGLSSSIFSADLNRALRIANRIESGMCHINGPTIYDEAHIPFGGTKDSGYGRFGGMSSIQEFTQLKWITAKTGADL